MSFIVMLLILTIILTTKIVIYKVRKIVKKVAQSTNFGQKKIHTVPASS